ncbi:MAG: hypothetical protein GY839_05300, partial [candidate division Zixibacteria bacterium]|nr:hypothetical protein [candidate division Zixibacteria bacterium]
MKNIYKMIGLGLILILMATSAFGQASSTNYKLEVGTPVGGGGGSNSTNYSLSGAFPISPGGVSGSTNYGVIGGVASVTGAGAAFMVEINRPPISLAGIENIPIEVIYDSPDNTASGTLYYRQSGQTTYTEMA